MVKTLFTQNSDLKRTGIWAWTLPAHIVHLTDGSRFNTCPNAGICAALCYAKSGRWNFSNVKAAHVAKLEMVLSDPAAWQEAIIAELHKKKYAGGYIRIHDGGDFFSQEYALRWAAIATAHPDLHFYAYTKEVAMFKLLQKGYLPDNFTIIYSYGGRQDHLIDPAVDRHSEVFPTIEALWTAGYVDIEADDKLAATHPNHRVGLVANNISHLKRKQGNLTFGDWQQGKRPAKPAV
jgi:hypothetical protein